jgi:hypothetical protein
MLTVQEVKERILKSQDADDILMLLDISAEELLDRFEDKIEERHDRLCKDFAEAESDQRQDT